MLALPPAPAPAPRRQLFIGASVACSAGLALLGGMLALWVRFRNDAINNSEDHRWLPKGIEVPEVASNLMLFGFVAIGVFAQWAVYSARRNDRQHTGMALGLTALIGVAIINAQAAVYAQMELPIRSEGGTSAYGVMFYAITGTFMVFVIIGVVFATITAFRYLGGRTTEREIVTAHAIYWYFTAAAFCLLWFVVYVTK